FLQFIRISSMKTISWIILVTIITSWNCNSTSGKSISIPKKEDSLEYYPPTPVVLDKLQFRRYYRELSHYFDSTLLSKGFNGGILIAKEGAVVYENYSGFADLRTKVPMTDTTMMHIASASKTFTGMATLRLVQENLLSLSDPLEKFFPE